MEQEENRDKHALLNRIPGAEDVLQSQLVNDGATVAMNDEGKNGDILLHNFSYMALLRGEIDNSYSCDKNAWWTGANQDKNKLSIGSHTQSARLHDKMKGSKAKVDSSKCDEVPSSSSSYPAKNNRDRFQQEHNIGHEDIG